ncbi:PREDICTED: poly(ADP-ribose) glycohydrolase 1-like isoform X3 [Nelumbo nucifera]|uniref:Poly(ADP-ribose) glycohydrolase 1-like isoform X3 n=1 Tax=Nelumbo nucifera TaxID=4432 RepID=A0A1U8B9I7_NELNU|nr:PREDICTED: poly(ADP-ribose) glycohydrolase 1-like isoform X3 [Nelumbo nucifera]
MENREDLNSILSFLPLGLQSSSLAWSSQVVETLRALSRGPDHSRVDSGEVFFLAISDMRESLRLSFHLLALSAAEGYALFFDDLMSRVEALKWFGEVVPVLAALLLRLPSLLENHYRDADDILSGRKEGLSGVKTGLRILGPQEAGIVVLSQELISALLACSFFCLFPTYDRGVKHLPAINFDCLFADFWSRSAVSLCHFEVLHSGLIEDQPCEALQVDFANKYIGGGALHRGCVQEEICFMINPELIISMLFLPSMADNEAIEIVGAERFSNYTGYASSFRFSGDYQDRKPTDLMGRRKTRIIAIDALCNPKLRQYRLEFLLRETNKAFCGFFDQSKCHLYQKMFQEAPGTNNLNKDAKEVNNKPGNAMLDETPSTSEEQEKGASGAELIENSYSEPSSQYAESQENIGVVTGNWGCGAFGGDPELKTIVQWLAASQALRPFISHCTFGEEALRTLDQVSQWILSHEWTVGDLWNLLAEYSNQRLKGETNIGFFTWLLPSLPMHDSSMVSDKNCI